MRLSSIAYLHFAMLLNCTISCGEDGNGAAGDSPTVGGSGQGGSTASIAIIGNDLFTLNNNRIQRFDISNAQDPVLHPKVGHVQLSQKNDPFNAQTLFRHGEHLLVGGDLGIRILQINSETSELNLIGSLGHFRGCDPVVAEGNTAYVTIRTNRRCRSFSDGAGQLQIVDVTDLTAPKLVGTHEMLAPIGLAVANERLYVCDSTDGIKLFDVSDSAAVRLTHQFDTERCQDVLISGDRLITTEANSGIRQYQIESQGILTRLSEIAIGSGA